jgi:hypothetical protein
VNVIESDSGFAVEVLGQTGMRYTERGRALNLYSEVLAKQDAIAIWQGTIRKWDSPSVEAEISQEERNRIIANIQRAFDAMGFELQVI